MSARAASDVRGTDPSDGANWLTERENRLKEAAATLRSSPEEVPARVASLIEDRRPDLLVCFHRFFSA